jgi:hypothetical protein
VQISAEDDGTIVKGRIDVLVIQNQLWILVIESKRAGFSLEEVIPQALAYILANPDANRPIFGLVTNGSHFIFIKLSKQDTPQYALSYKFSLRRPENELYSVLSILKRISQLLGA